MGRPVVHWEFWSEDPARIAKFYEQVFDWTTNEIPGLDYTLVEKEENGIGGGIMKPKDGPWPAQMCFYIDVDDLEAYGAKIREAGGTMIVENMEVQGVGHLSLFQDPDGRVIGMWKQGG